MSYNWQLLLWNIFHVFVGHLPLLFWKLFLWIFCLTRVVVLFLFVALLVISLFGLLIFYQTGDLQVFSPIMLDISSYYWLFPCQWRSFNLWYTIFPVLLSFSVLVESHWKNHHLQQIFEVFSIYFLLEMSEHPILHLDLWFIEI